VWASEGWQDTITKDEGKVFAPAEIREFVGSSIGAGLGTSAMPCFEP
jgi:hypothetical protein